MMAAAIINGALYLPEESMLLMSARAKFTAAMTSATPAQRAMSAERRSIIPFQTFASLVIACITGRKQWTIQFGSQFLYCGFLNNGICAVYGSYPQVRMSAPYGFVSALSASRLDKHLAVLAQRCGTKRRCLIRGTFQRFGSAARNCVPILGQVVGGTPRQCLRGERRVVRPARYP